MPRTASEQNNSRTAANNKPDTFDHLQHIVAGVVEDSEWEAARLQVRNGDVRLTVAYMWPGDDDG